jgi:L-lactate dehydrogenase complex protein LldG
MNSRDSVLGAVRRHQPSAVPLPDLDGPWITYADPVAQFVATLEMIGGRCVRVPTIDVAQADLLQQQCYQSARKIVSAVPGLGQANVRMESMRDPHELQDVDLAILPGEFGVAENGAVWVTDAGVPHRVIYFLCQHLVLVLPGDAVVHNMHQAYERVRFPAAGFGTFLSGPSKTADIEQSLVIGAHGPKSTTVYLVG